MNIYPIATNRLSTIMTYKPTTFRGDSDSTNTTITQGADVAQFASASGTNLRKTHSKGFVSKLNAFFNPTGIEKIDPRNSENPWIRAFLY